MKRSKERGKERREESLSSSAMSGLLESKNKRIYDPNKIESRTFWPCSGREEGREGHREGEGQEEGDDDQVLVAASRLAHDHLKMKKMIEK